MLMARSYSPFVTHSAAIAEQARAATYPPLFPALIACLGAGFRAGHVLVVASLLGSVAVLYGWLRVEGIARWSAAWTCLVFTLMPGTYLLSLSIWSENPYLLVSLLAVLACSCVNAGGQAGPQRYWWIAAIACAAAPMLRTAGATLLPAFAAVALIKRPRRWQMMILLSVLPFALWALWSHVNDTGIGHYAAQWGNTYATDFRSRLSQQLRTEAIAIRAAWVRAWLGDVAPPAFVQISDLFGILCICGWLARLAQRRFDAFYIAIYATLILAWPWPGEAQRLCYVAMPILIVQGIVLLHRLAGSRMSDQRYAWAAPVLILSLLTFLILPALCINAIRREEPVAGNLEAIKFSSVYYISDRKTARWFATAQVRILNDLSTLNERVGPSDCVFFTKAPVATLMSSRMSRAPPPESTTDDVFAHEISSCRYAYVTALSSPSYPDPMYPLERLKTPPRVISNLDDPEIQDPHVLASLVELSSPQN
jgi:hypothetical protein